LIEEGTATGLGGAKAVDALDKSTMEAAKAAYENDSNRRKQLEEQALDKQDETNDLLGDIKKNTNRLRDIQPIEIEVV
jgi:hypothetical protein